MNTSEKSPVSPPPPACSSFILHPSSFFRLVRLTRKELSEVLRDRRTILTLVLMPLILYPLLSITFQQFFLASGLSLKLEVEHKLGFTTLEEAALVLSELELGGQQLQQEPRPRERPGSAKPPTVAPEFIVPDLEEKLRERVIDLGVRVRKLAPVHRRRSGEDRALDCELLYLEGSVAGLNALEFVERRLAAANRTYLEKRLGLPGPPVVLVRSERTSVPPLEGGGFLSLAALVPLVLILMTITGAVYPAIDLTAGERERGTLEILVAAPVPRLSLLLAKYVAVVAVAILTALINMVTMTATVLLSGLGPWLFGGRGLSALVEVLLPLFGLLLLFAAFFSALLLALTSFARSFKEAQAYLIPLMLAALGPGLLGMLPGLKLAGPLVVVPLLNMVLLARDLFEGRAELAVALIVVLVTFLYALAAIAIAARVFGAEEVLYNEQHSWSDLFRRPSDPSPTPTLAGALTCFALLFPAAFLLQGLLMQVPPESRLACQVLGSVALFGGSPFLAAWLRRVTLRTCFQVQSAPWWSFLAAFLLGVILVPLTYGLLAGLQKMKWTLLGPEHEQQIAELLRQWRDQPAVVVAGSFALIGVAEELFFRGYLFSALRQSNRAAVTIAVSALVFGLFHFISTFDRLLPSTLLGLVLGWLCWQSRSVWPGMLLHAVYNAGWVLLAYYQK